MSATGAPYFSRVAASWSSGSHVMTSTDSARPTGLWKVVPGPQKRGTLISKVVLRGEHSTASFSEGFQR